MSSKDIFFPSNQGKREEIARLSGKLFFLVDNCFVATNKLIDCIQKYLPGRTFDKHEMDTSKSLRHNCDLIIQRLGELKMYLEETKISVEKQMNPEIFKKLVSPDTSFMEKVKIAKLSSTTIIGIAGSVAGVVLCGALNTENMFAITRVLGVLKNCDVATISLGVLAVGQDTIASAIIEAIERGQLDNSLNNYQRVEREFQPAVEDFYDNIGVVKAKIELTA